MEIKSFLHIIIKRIWILILLMVLTSAVSVYINFFVMKPVYEANTTLLITNPVNNSMASIANTITYENIIAGQSLVSEYSEIIKSKRVISEVIEEINEKDITEKSLRKMISIDSVNGTRILNISIKNNHPAKAAIIADSVAKAFSMEIVKLYKIENVDIIDKAEVPAEPVEPEKNKNIAISVAIAFVFGLTIIFVLDYLDNTIKNSDDVKKYLGLNVIGNIPVYLTNLQGEKQ